MEQPTEERRQTAGRNFLSSTCGVDWGADHNNQLRAKTPVGRQAKNCYTYILFSVINVCITNAFIFKGVSSEINEVDVHNF
jgi:hypothetical protein